MCCNTGCVNVDSLSFLLNPQWSNEKYLIQFPSSLSFIRSFYFFLPSFIPSWLFSLIKTWRKWGLNATRMEDQASMRNETHPQTWVRHCCNRDCVERATQSGPEFQTYEPFYLYFIFHVIFLTHDKPRITETMVTESADMGFDCIS